MRSLLLLVASIGVLLSCGTSFGSILPKNDLYLQDNYFAANMTEEDFKKALASTEAVYKPIVKALGGNLTVIPMWSSSEVNAYAQRIGKTFKIVVFGGIGRRPEITINSLILIVCHELGHFVAGTPLYSGEDMSVEGQSDAYATAVCAKKMFATLKDDVTDLSPVAVEDCEEIYGGQDLKVCLHTMKASKELGDLLGVLNGGAKPQFETPSTRVVKRTQESHPSSQCRLDQYASGALCTKKWNDKIIPTKSNDNQYNCERRRCWYAP